MSTQKVVRGVKQFTLPTGGQKVLCSDEKGIKLLCEGKGVSVNSHKVEKERIVPFGSYQMRTPVTQDIVTCICIAKNSDKGFVGCLSGRITPLSSGGSGDSSWSAHASKVTGLHMLEKTSKTLLWSCSTDGFLKIWEGNRAVAKASGHRGDVYDVVHVPFASGGGIMWSCGYDKTIRVWDKNGTAAAGVGSGRRPTSLKCSEPATALAVDTDQNVVWSCDKANVRAWSADTRNCVWCSVRGGTSITLLSKYIVTLTDNGSSIAVYSRKMTNTDSEIPPLTVFSSPEKSCSRVVSISLDRLAISSGHGIHILLLEEAKLDPTTELVIEKAKHESVGVIFRSDKHLALERVEPGSAAERCGATRFLGWQLSHVNGNPVNTVADVIAAIKRQLSFLCKFKQGGELGVPSVKRQPSDNRLKRRGSNTNVARHDAKKLDSSDKEVLASPVVPSLSVPVPENIEKVKSVPKEKKVHSKPVNPIIQAGQSQQPPSSQVSAGPATPVSPVVSPVTVISAPAFRPARTTSPVQVTASPTSAELVTAVRTVTGSTAAEDELSAILMAYVSSIKDELHSCKVKAAAQLAEKDGQILELTKQNSQADLTSSMKEMIENCIDDSLLRGLRPAMTTLDEVAISIGDIKYLQESFKDLNQSLNNQEAKQEGNDVNGSSAQEPPSPTSKPDQPQPQPQPSPKPKVEEQPRRALSYTDSKELDALLTRCGDTLASLYALAGTSDWAQHESSPHAKVEEMLRGLKGLHTEICHKEGATVASPEMHVVNQAITGLLSHRLVNGESSAQREASLPQRSTSREKHVPPLAANLTLSQGSAPLTPPRRRHASHSTDREPPEYVPETTDIRQSPSPLMHTAIPPCSDEDAQWGRLFEMRNRLQQWLQWKPKQLVARAAQAKREALEKGIKAIDAAFDELESYHVGERMEYVQMWEEVQEGLGVSSPHGTESLSKGWEQLDAAEDSLLTTLEKLRKEYGDPQAVLNSVRHKIGEFRQYIEETTRDLNAATQKYSDSVKDVKIYKYVIRAVGVDAWCRARKLVQFLDSVDMQIEGIDGAHDAYSEAKAVGHAWAALEIRLVGDPPTSEMKGHIEFVLAVLQLARVVTQQQVDPDLACAAIEDVIGGLLPSHQQMVARLKDHDPDDDDTLLALETLCDEILRYYTLALQPMLEQDGKDAYRIDELSEALVRILKADCKLRSHHVPRHQLDIAQITSVVAKVANQEFMSAAVLTTDDIDSMCTQSLTKGGSIVILNTFCRLAAFQLIKLNQSRYPQYQQYSLDTPRTSLDSLFSFFSSRIRTVS